MNSETLIKIVWMGALKELHPDLDAKVERITRTRVTLRFCATRDDGGYTRNYALKNGREIGGSYPYFIEPTALAHLREIAAGL